mmetsp:Transcript_46283/g.86716  ORF Transcript_46283/g.86716 Transcript_46283/m.86716 type:complete len:452 (+) Transcript_46283:51-1406(+)
MGSPSMHGVSDSDFEQYQVKLREFMRTHIYPNEKLFEEQSRAIADAGNEWYDPPILVELKGKAKSAGLWNLWLSRQLASVMDLGPEYEGPGLSNLQYAQLCAIMGTSNHMEFASHAMNCCSPDTGNMETLGRFGTREQKEKWLKTLLDGTTRSAYAMTEPQHASSDAKNVRISIHKEMSAGEYVINGEKWWITGAGSLHCNIIILLGAIDGKQSVVLVPMDTPGITLLRPMKVLGDDDAPKGHMHILFENVRVPFANILAGEGRGGEIAQARLGPGRLHHCMRAIGTAERAIALMCYRTSRREAFGKKLSEFDSIVQDIAKSRNEITMCTMLVENAAHKIDTSGSKAARKELSMCKSVVPRTVQHIVDRAMQAHGAMGLSQDTFLATAFNWARWLRYADGPDEVHWKVVGSLELKEQAKSELALLGHYPVNKEHVFRRSTDPISPAARARL